MSLNPDIRDQAYQFFIEEAQELLQVLETGLLDLRQDHSTPKVHELMRAAHSIKGGAASVELSAIELLAHRLEDFFKALYSDSVEFDAELEGLLLQGYDCLRNPLKEQIEQGSFDEETALLTAEPVFAALEVRLEDALQNSDNYIPSATDLGVDIVSSIFEVDVVKALEHLGEVASNPESYDPAAELEAQLDMFAGFAELFNLPGFSDIVQTSQTALSQNSAPVLEIINITVADCTIAKDQILAGDREQGGQVSPALRELAQSTTTGDIWSGNTETNNAFDEIVLDSPDNLWSSESATELLAEDIFGNLPEEQPAIAEVGSETIEDEDLSVNDIFGNLPEEESAVVEVSSENIEDEDLSVSDIFGNLPEEESAGVEVSSENIEDEDLSVSDIFGTLLEEESAGVEVSSENIEDEDLSVSDIFGTLPEEESAVVEVAQEAIEDEDPEQEKETKLTEDNHQSSLKNIEAAVESIGKLFDSLPSVENIPDSLSLPYTKTDSSLSQSPEDKPAESEKMPKTAAKLSVRVDLDRLEKMNNLVGELTINRNSLALQNQQLQEHVSELAQKFFRFREVSKKLREISDTMLLEEKSNNLGRSIAKSPSNDHHANSSTNITDASTEFDSLEMDSYNALYPSLQEILEEMVQLEESVDDITIFAQQSDRTINIQRQMLGQMRDELMWVRMLPLDKILQRFPRTLRDLSHKYQKPVDLKLTGTGVLVDKAVLEKLSDPLLHLLRNGFDHGIEEPEVRTNQDKTARGLIEIHAYYQGNQTVIEVKDDGQGLDLAKITHKAIAKGLISSQEAAAATKERLFELIFEPGFSTASKVSEISGRGVGMNIVRSQIETLKGKITVASSPGEGSTFTLRLPLTLTIAKLLVCSLGSTSFAIPSDSIEEIIIPTEEQIKFANEQKFLYLNTKLIPIYPLKEVLQYNCPTPDTNSASKAFKTITPPEDWSAPLLILRQGQKLFALEIVDLITEQELVIKPYGKAIAPPPYTYGCTILGDGSLIPAFDGAALISTILGEEINPIASESPLLLELEDSDSPSKTIKAISTNSNDNLIGEVAVSSKITSFKTIMVVDDSTALRRTMALTLEKQGYRVIQKKDGKDALDGFRQNPNLDLIICDIEMPTMNGFEFLGMRRRDSALSEIPTFMLTSRSGAKHRNLAMQLGANGYFTKPYIEKEFIAEIKKTLENNVSSNIEDKFLPDI